MEYAEKRETARQIADVMGWFIEPERDHYASSITLRAPGDSGHRIWLRWEDHDTRIVVHPHYPKDRHGQESCPSSYEPKADTIRVSATKPPATIAREIARRFLPAYETAFAVQAQRVAGRNAYALATAEGVERLKALGGVLWGQSSDDNVSLHFPNTHVHQAHVQGESVRFEHMSVPLEVAIKILEACKKAPSDEQQD